VQKKKDREEVQTEARYAIALPGCSLLYHGVRTPGLIPALQPLTAERSSLLAYVLWLTNDAFAMELVKRAISFHFPQARVSEGTGERQSAFRLDCFIEVISPKLSRGAKRVLKKSQQRYAKFQSLLMSLLCPQRVFLIHSQFKINDSLDASCFLPCRTFAFRTLGRSRMEV